MADNKNDSGLQVFKSKVFTTEAVRAVFPHLNEVGKYGGYTISVDVLENPEFLKTVESNADDVLAAARKKLATKKVPTNPIVKDGEYEGEPWRRMTFKMNGSRKTREGEEIQQSPRLVDADRKPMNDEIWGGSLVKIAYFIQYTITPTGTYLSLKLNAVQVLTLVGPNGEVAVEDLFDEEVGFTVAQVEAPLVETVPVGTMNEVAPMQTGSDF